MWFVLPPMTGPILRRSWKGQGSLSPGTLLTTTALLIQTCLTPPFPVADRLTSGSVGAQRRSRSMGSVTCALRLGPALSDPPTFAGVFTSVGSRTNAFFSTASQYSQAGITFGPLVLEAVEGGWSDALGSAGAWIGSESKRCGPISGSDASFKIAQRISCTLHRENARAILN